MIDLTQDFEISFDAEQAPQEPQKPETPEVEKEENPEESAQAEFTEEERAAYAENHFKFMTSQGYLNVPEDFEYNGNLVDAYVADFEYRKQLAAEEFMNQLPEEVRTIAQYGLSGGQNIDELAQLKNEQKNISSLNFDADEALAEEFLLNHYSKNLNLGNKRATTLITSLKDEGELVNEAKTLKQARLAQAQAKEQEMLQQQALLKQQQEADDQKYFNEVNVHLGEQKWSPTTINKVKNEIYSNSYQNKFMHILQNDPKAFVQLAAILSTYDPDKGFGAFIDKKATQHANRQVKDKFFDSFQTSTPVLPNSRQKPQSKVFEDLPPQFDIKF